MRHDEWNLATKGLWQFVECWYLDGKPSKVWIKCKFCTACWEFGLHMASKVRHIKEKVCTVW